MTKRLVTAGLLPLLLLAAAAACAGPDGARVASAGGSATPSATPSLSFHEQGLRYAQCLRQHGAPVADPQVDANGEDHILGPDKHSIDNDTLTRALEACKQYKPVLPPAVLDQKLASVREYARCMRAHGVEAFPDPEPDGRIRLPEEQTDPDYDQAKAVCDAQAQSARPSTGASR